jgi:hypothetical protein
MIDSFDLSGTRHLGCQCLYHRYERHIPIANRDEPLDIQFNMQHLIALAS